MIQYITRHEFSKEQPTKVMNNLNVILPEISEFHNLAVLLVRATKTNLKQIKEIKENKKIRKKIATYNLHH